MTNLNTQFVENDEIELKSIINILWYRKKTIALITISAVILGFLFSLVQYHFAKPIIEYEAASTLRFEFDDSVLYQDELFLSLLSSETAIKNAISDLSVSKDFSYKNITVTNESKLTKISVRYPTKNEARMITDEIVNHAIIVTNESLKGVSVVSRELANITQQFSAIKPPSFKTNLIIAFLLGFGFASVLILFDKFSKGKISDPQELEREFGIPVLASFPLKNKNLLQNAYLKGVSQLSSNLINSQSQVYEIIDYTRGEYKDIIYNSVLKLSEFGKKVCMISLDFRGDLTNDAIAINVFLEDKTVFDEVINRSTELLYLTTMEVDDTEKLIMSKEFRELTSKLYEIFDILFIYVPQSETNSNELLISEFVDQAILLIDLQNIKKSYLKENLKVLWFSNIHIFGAILSGNRFNKKLID